MLWIFTVCNEVGRMPIVITAFLNVKVVQTFSTLIICTIALFALVVLV